MSIKCYLLLIYLISQIIFISCSSEDPVYNGEIWTPESLYEFVKNTYLNRNNPDLDMNLKHMIVDPEKYLEHADLRVANQYLQDLYQLYNISCHVYFISKMQNKYDLEEEVASFVSKLTFLLYKTYDNFDENAITAVFFIKDRKMRIRTSRDLRQILTDNDCLNILNKRKSDLRRNNFEEVANGLVKDLFNTYKIKIEHKDIDNNIIIFTIIFIIIIAIIFSIFNNNEKSTKNEDKVKVFLDKLKKRENPKEIFSESCIICLDDFESNEKIKELEKSGNKEAFEKAETSVLECGHKFHRKCIADWLKKESNCPMCRMKFDIKDSNDGSKGSSSQSTLNFQNIMSEILRIQSNGGFLNQREVTRIRNYYYPSESRTKSYSTTHNKSYSSYNKESGGATSGW